jgi:hypothetical protein
MGAHTAMENPGHPGASASRKPCRSPNTFQHISGAACHHPRFNTVLINRREPDGRRNYDFAHETFHVLTWKTMPPRHVDEVASVQGSKAKRVEQLVDNFASALLMPESSLRARWERRGEQEIHDWLNATASEFQVTAVALYWRLRHLGWLTSAASLEVDPQRLTWNGLSPSAQTLPNLFSRRFVERLRVAWEMNEFVHDHVIHQPQGKLKKFPVEKQDLVSAARTPAVTELTNCNPARVAPSSRCEGEHAVAWRNAG